jgi:hypothetical protein
MNGGEGTFEMLWDCRHCQQKKLLGLTHRCCPNCGAPQDASLRYFPADEDRVAVQNHRYAGADVQCPACQAWNGRASNCCCRCGSPLTGARDATRQADQVHAEGVAFGTGPRPQNAGYGYGAPAAAPMPAPAPVPAAKKSFVWLWITVAAVVLFGGCICVAVSWKRSASFEVTGHPWHRTIDVETYSLVRASAWCNELPIGARELSRHREQHGTTRLQDGEDCQTRRKDNGDGTYKQVRECKPSTSKSVSASRGTRRRR